jgi:4-hydroxybenzoate polyprenyltransferase
MLKQIRLFLTMIKFSHTVFALPFALMGALLAGRGWPAATVLGWVLLAMVGARTAAMGFNRIVDRRIDRANPRTADRALATGELSLASAVLLVVTAAALFFVACAQLNPLTLRIAPLALAVCLGYSFTKRFTWLSHAVLGAALAFSPLGGWIAVAGSVDGYPFALSAAVLLWVAGFDIVYACMDVDFDRQRGLYSLPARFGRHRALRIAAVLHLAAFALFMATGLAVHLGPAYLAGLAVTAGALAYQHRVISADDLSRIQLSFFRLNAVVSVTLLATTWAALSL